MDLPPFWLAKLKGQKPHPSQQARSNTMTSLHLGHCTLLSQSPSRPLLFLLSLLGYYFQLGSHVDASNLLPIERERLTSPCCFEAPFYRQRKPSFQHPFVAGYDKRLEVLRCSLLCGIQRTRYRVRTRHSTRWKFSCRLDLWEVLTEHL